MEKELVVFEQETESKIIIKQLPVIVERLQEVKAGLVKRLATVMAMPVTRESVKEIKKLRAELNKEFLGWEERRKYVKTTINDPYEKFLIPYKDCISDQYTSADTQLRDQIGVVESGIKKETEDEIKVYFADYVQSKKVDFLTFDRLGISVGLSSTITALKKEVAAFVDKVADDINLIYTQEDSEEMMVEYRKTLNAARAITEVKERKESIRIEQERKAERDRIRQEEKAAADKLKAMLQAAEDEAPAPAVEAAPVEEPRTTADVPDPMDDVLTIAFKVTATRRKLKELKLYLLEGGYKYE